MTPPEGPMREVDVGALLEEEAPAPIEDHGGDAGPHAERFAVVGLVRDHAGVKSWYAKA